MMFALLSVLLFASPAWSASSPLTIALTTEPRGAKDIIHHKSNKCYGGKSKSQPLQVQFNGTELQWFGEIGFGTPPQNFQVVFDTDSFTREIPGIQCGQPCQNQKKFDFTKSSTFTSTNETGEIIFETGGGVLPSKYLNTFYKDDYASLQYLEVVDTMTLSGICVPNTTFFLITNQSAEFYHHPFDGIIGLSYQPSNAPGIFKTLKENGLPALFSLFLTPHTIGHAELTLGGIDDSKLHGHKPIWAPILPPTDQPNSWTLAAANVLVNRRAVEKDLFNDIAIVFDSATSSMVMPKNLTVAIYALISPKIKPFGNLGAFGMPCREINSLPAEITFTFTSTSGKPFDLIIPSEGLNVGPFKDDPSTCQTMINALDIGPKGTIGGSLLKHYYSIWDVDNARIGFVPNGF